MTTKCSVLETLYQKIPFNPEIDSCNLNSELVHEMCLNSHLEELIRAYPSWTEQDLEQIAIILKVNGWALWEIEIIFESYNPVFWSNITLEAKDRIKNIVESETKNPDKAFNVDYDLYPFRVSKNGIEIHNNKDDQEDYTLITQTPIIITAIGQNLDDDMCLYQCTYKNITGQISKKWLSPGQLLTSDLKALADMGLHINDSDFKNLKQYFKKLLTHSHKIPTEYTATKSGWKQDNTIFITGSFAHTAQGKQPILSLTDEIANLYTTKGNKEEWREVLTQLLEYDLVRIKCYAAVAAMIVRLVNVQSFVVHNYYESSGLKSVTMQVAASVIGDPFELIRDADCTKVGLEMTAVINTDTPLFIDETSNNKEFSDAIYLLANEKGKTRGDVSNNSVGLAKIGRWKTVVQTTGEYSLTQYLSTGTGVGMRVIEIYEGIPKLDEDYVERVKETISNNYGLFLDEIVQQIFIAKPILKKRFHKIREDFEKSSTTFAARKKNYFAALTLAGTILENVFDKNKIPKKDPKEICKKYYDSTAVSDPTIPYYKKALETVYSWHLRNKRSFEYSPEIDPDGVYSPKGITELKGWVTAKGIIYDVDMLRKYLEEKELNFDRAVKDWTEQGILERRKDGRSWKYDTTIKGQKIRGIFITFDKIQEVLNINKGEIAERIKPESDETKEECEIIKGSGEKSRVGLRKVCEEYLKDNPELLNITYPTKEVTTRFISTIEGSTVLSNYKIEDIEKMIESCKKRNKAALN